MSNIEYLIEQLDDVRQQYKRLRAQREKIDHEIHWCVEEERRLRRRIEEAAHLDR